METFGSSNWTNDPNEPQTPQQVTAALIKHLTGRFIKVFEDGNVSAINFGSDGVTGVSYNVQIGYREFPYDSLQLSNSSKSSGQPLLGHGDPVRIGFLDGNPLLPFIIRNQAQSQLGGIGTVIPGFVLQGNGLWLAPEALASVPYGLTKAIPLYLITNPSPINLATIARTADSSTPTEQFMAGIPDPRGMVSFTSPGGAITVASFCTFQPSAESEAATGAIITEVTSAGAISTITYQYQNSEIYFGGFNTVDFDFDPDRHGGYLWYHAAQDWYTICAQSGMITIPRGSSLPPSSVPYSLDTLRAERGPFAISAKGDRLLECSYLDYISSTWDSTYNNGAFAGAFYTGAVANMWVYLREADPLALGYNGQWYPFSNFSLRSYLLFGGTPLPGGIGRIFGVGIVSSAQATNSDGWGQFEYNFDTLTGGGPYGGAALVTPGTGDSSAVYENEGFHLFSYGVELQIRSSRWPEIPVSVTTLGVTTTTTYWWFYANCLNNSNVPYFLILTLSQFDLSGATRAMLTPPGGTPAQPYSGYLADQIAAAYAAAAASRVSGGITGFATTFGPNFCAGGVGSVGKWQGTNFLGDQKSQSITMGAGTLTNSPTAPGSPTRYYAAPLPGPGNATEISPPPNPVSSGSTTSDQSCSGVPDEAGANHYQIIFEAERCMVGYTINPVIASGPGDSGSTVSASCGMSSLYDTPQNIAWVSPGEAIMPDSLSLIQTYYTYRLTSLDAYNYGLYAQNTTGAPSYGDRWRTYLIVTPAAAGPAQKIEISQLLSWNIAYPGGIYGLLKAVDWPGFQNVFQWIPHGGFLFLLREWVPTNDAAPRSFYLQILDAGNLPTQLKLYNLQPPTAPTLVPVYEYQPRAFVGYDSNSQPHITVYSAWDPLTGADGWANRRWSRTRIVYAPDPGHPGGPAIPTRTDSMDTGYPAGAPTVAELAASCMDQNGDLICLKNAQVLVKF